MNTCTMEQEVNSTRKESGETTLLAPSHADEFSKNTLQTFFFTTKASAFSVVGHLPPLAWSNELTLPFEISRMKPHDAISTICRPRLVYNHWLTLWILIVLQVVNSMRGTQSSGILKQREAEQLEFDPQKQWHGSTI